MEIAAHKVIRLFGWRNSSQAITKLSFVFSPESPHTYRPGPVLEAPLLTVIKDIFIVIAISSALLCDSRRPM
jgi:hypothetical protein